MSYIKLKMKKNRPSPKKAIDEDRLELLPGGSLHHPASGLHCDVCRKHEVDLPNLT